MDKNTAVALSYENGRLVRGTLACIAPGRGVNGASGPTGVALATVEAILDLGAADPSLVEALLLPHVAILWEQLRQRMVQALGGGGDASGDVKVRKRTKAKRV
jgi:hypothetical protein